jgi:hypothetical protein
MSELQAKIRRSSASDEDLFFILHIHGGIPGERLTITSSYKFVCEAPVFVSPVDRLLLEPNKQRQFSPSPSESRRPLDLTAPA